MPGTLITIEEFKEAMPAHVRKNVNDGLMVEINNAMQDPETLAVYRENVVGLTSVMREGKFKMNDYLNAVKFVTHKLLADDNVTAWSKTFPTRYREALQRGTDRSAIASIASRYGSSKLVILLMGQTMMPTHILNAPLFQKALNVQATLMMTAVSEKVRCEAAANLLMTLKPPEIRKVELDIAVREDDTIRALRATTLELSRKQQAMIENGELSVKSVAESKLIDLDDYQDAEILN